MSAINSLKLFMMLASFAFTYYISIPNALVIIIRDELSSMRRARRGLVITKNVVVVVVVVSSFTRNAMH